ncbi:MAG TPA: HesA/MoeB/ThiF family protein [Chitinophagales bacterium]|nr:HesA/MoeB/ThiF family protein [Chitinophagales bacterium]
MNNFTSEEIIRYSRQIVLNEIGESGQQKLKAASVLMIGAGGLGVPVLQYLAASGVGKIGIIDGDKIELSNLHRQVLYEASEIGSWKSEVARVKLLRLNSEVKIISYPEFLTSENATEIISGYSIIVDGSDNFPTRYLVNDVCVKLGKPFVSGAIFKFSGQVGVFNYNGSGTYRCLFPNPPKPEEQPDCNEAGVMGVVPGLIGMMMANEAIKMICGIGEVLAGKILNVDLLTNNFQTFSFRRDDEAVEEIKLSPLRSSHDFEMFCHRTSSPEAVKEISAEELKKIFTNGNNIQLIDVREPLEHEEENIGGELIPFEEVMKQAGRISRDKQVVFYCKVGMRSHIVIQRLQEKFGMKNLYNLRGGINQYFQR